MPPPCVCGEKEKKDVTGALRKWAPAVDVGRSVGAAAQLLSIHSRRVLCTAAAAAAAPESTADVRLRTRPPWLVVGRQTMVRYVRRRRR